MARRWRVEHFHHHFEHAAQKALRLYEWEPFEHLVIGGLWETLPQFEGHLHRYLRDRIIARWDIDVRTPTPQILERARLTLRDENGKPYNYVARLVPRPSPTPADWPTITRASATHGSTRR